MYRLEKWFVLLLCMFVACSAMGQVVPVELAVSFSRTDAVAAAPAAAKASDDGDVWIFVLDYSWSMTASDAMVYSESGQSRGTIPRWQALREAVQVTLENIEIGSIVQVVKVCGQRAELVISVPIRGNKERQQINETIGKWKPSNRNHQGLTPLYHGLFLACQQADRFISAENRNVGIIVFSDGRDQSDRAYTQASLNEFKDIFDQDAFNACLTWLDANDNDLPEPPFGPKYVWAKPPKSGNVVPVVCRVRPAVPFVSVQNPLSGEGRTEIPVAYSLPLPEEKWKAILAGGFEANLQLISNDGQVVGGEAISVGTSPERVVFRIPESSFQGQMGAEFSLKLDLPQTAQGCRFVSPRPIRLAFEKQGSVTLSEVAPQSGVAVKAGETVRFSAQGTAGAGYTWSFGDGEKVQGQRVSHAFASAAPKGISFSVLAEKRGLTSATSSGTIFVLDAGVSMDSIPAVIKVGSPVEFSCKGKGDVHSFEWFIDGVPVAGGQDAPDCSSSKLSFTFTSPGRHSVRVRANMKRVSPEETQDMPFQVAEAPYAAVLKPEANDIFMGGDLAEFEARIQGGFTSGIWQVTDETGTPVGEPVVSPIAERVARAKFVLPENGGRYSVVFRAGEGTETVQSDPVTFSAKPKDVRIDVVAPIRDAVVKTDAKTELRVMTKGVPGTIGFYLLEGDKEKVLGAPVKIAGDGTAALAWTFPAKDGQGDRSLVVRSEDGRIESDPLSFVLETEAGLVLEKPLYNASVAYGESLDFEAAVSGVIDAKSVQWFLRPIGGEEQELPDGKTDKCSHRFDAVPNRKSLTYEVYARAPMPDGGVLESDHVVVRAGCISLNPVLLLDAKIHDAGQSATFTVQHAGSVARYAWDFGDGHTAESNEPQMAHAYDRPGNFTVTVGVVCSMCGEESSAIAVAEIRCPDLAPVLSIARGADGGDENEPFSRGKPIGMSLEFGTPGAAARAEGIAWDFGDGTTDVNLDTVSHSYDEYGDYTVALCVHCKVCGREETAKKTLRIDKVPPTAHFKICKSTSNDEPAGGWVAQGGTIVLVDHSTGDVANRRWTCDGRPIEGSEGRTSVEWDCRTVGKHVFELTAVDPGGECSAPECHSVRVYRLWLVLLLGLLAAGATGWAWWYWGGDAPRFWKVGVRDDPEGSLAEDTGWQTKCRHSLRGYWKRGPNTAMIPLARVAKWCKASEEVWGKAEKKAKPGEAVLLVQASETEENNKVLLVPYAKVAGAKPEGMGMERFRGGYLWKLSRPVPNRPGERAALWVRVNPLRGPNTDLWVRLAWTLAFFGAAAWGIAKWGM